MAHGVTPFVFTFEPGNRHAIYHASLQNDMERMLAREFSASDDLVILPLGHLPADAEITNVSAIGAPAAIAAIRARISGEQHLVAYVGTAWEGDACRWIDVHHVEATKGGAIDVLRQQLGLTRVVCFGDSNNDLSMFEVADESYAPENANDAIKAVATAVIGHHDDEGIARFLRRRFDLDERPGRR